MAGFIKLVYGSSNAVACSVVQPKLFATDVASAHDTLPALIQQWKDGARNTTGGESGGRRVGHENMLLKHGSAKRRNNRYVRMCLALRCVSRKYSKYALNLKLY